VSDRRRNRRASSQARRLYLNNNATATRLIRTLQQTAVLFLAVFGFLFCMVTGYGLAVETARAVWTAIAFVPLYHRLPEQTPRNPASGLLSPGAVLGVAECRFVRAGYLLLIDQALGSLSLHLPDFLQTQMQTFDAQQTVELTTTGLQAVLYLTTLLAGYFVICRPSALGLAISTLPLLLPVPFYSLAPAVLPFFCLAAAHFMLYVHNSAGRVFSTDLQAEESPPVQNAKAESDTARPVQSVLSLFALPLVVLAALLACWVLPQKGYVRPAGIESLRQKILSLEIGGKNAQKSNNGLTHGDLRSLTNIRFTGECALKVRVSSERVFYLREYAGSLFTSDGWESVSETDYAHYAANFSGIAPQNLRSAAAAVGSAQFDSYTLSVRNVSATPRSIWTPDGLATTADEISGAIYVQDTALEFSSASGSADYSLEALSCAATLSPVPLADGQTDAASLKSAYLAVAGSEAGLSGAQGTDAQQVQSAAQAYLDYIFEIDTALPEETRQAAEQLCATYGLSLRCEDGVLNLYETCRDLYELLTGQCSYSYSPPDIPADADFATYFLEVSRRGYCVHFATTATVLLRSLGIPARYAEGYIVIPSDYEKQPDADGYLEIEDTHAHAWVEVFDPVQLEWIPMEMTASASGVSSSEDGDADETPDAETPSPTPTVEPTPTPEPTADATPSADAEETEEPGSTPMTESEDAQSSFESTPTPNPAEADDSATDGASQDGEGATGKRKRRRPPACVYGHCSYPRLLPAHCPPRFSGAKQP
jgi:transglutaminase-like putative cysteine protease